MFNLIPQIFSNIYKNLAGGGSIVRNLSKKPTLKVSGEIRVNIHGKTFGKFPRVFRMISRLFRNVRKICDFQEERSRNQEGFYSNFVKKTELISCALRIKDEFL